MTLEKTFILIKPDGVKRGLIGSIIQRYERAGLRLCAVKLVSCTREQAEEHYAEHRGKSFFSSLVALLTSGPSLAIAAEGAHAIAVVRKLNGDTEPQSAAPGTIRGDFAHMGYTRSAELKGTINNMVHASDSAESALRELSLWFDDSDYTDPYETVLKEFI
ncbi:MAG: nucleoside-diphosphate kinase [Spirochaetales bacterium]|nr:nucleoside-diphosphate kinase [Spirochaetales bacterium]